MKKAFSLLLCFLLMAGCASYLTPAAFPAQSPAPDSAASAETSPTSEIPLTPEITPAPVGLGAAYDKTTDCFVHEWGEVQRNYDDVSYERKDFEYNLNGEFTVSFVWGPDAVDICLQDEGFTYTSSTCPSENLILSSTEPSSGIGGVVPFMENQTIRFSVEAYDCSNVSVILNEIPLTNDACAFLGANTNLAFSCSDLMLIDSQTYRFCYQGGTPSLHILYYDGDGELDKQTSHRDIIELPAPIAKEVENPEETETLDGHVTFVNIDMSKYAGKMAVFQSGSNLPILIEPVK